MHQLRIYQAECLDRIDRAFKEGENRQLAVIFTGGGKTIVFGQIPRMFPGRKTMVLVHTEELAGQAAKKVKAWNPGLKVEIEMGDLYASDDADVIVGSVQTLGREGAERLKRFKPEQFGALVIDEAHHAVADGYKRIIAHFELDREETKNRLLLGVTATSERGDKQALAQVFDIVAYQYAMIDGVKDGFLVPPRGVRIKTGTDLSKLSGSALASAQSEELGQALNVKQRNELIVREWLAQAAGLRTIAFTASIQHAKDLAEEFRKAGVKAEAVWGDDPLRKDKLDAHQAGELTVVTNCAVLTEGYDDPGVECIILARPTSSQLLYVQMIGRGTRLPDGISNLHEARAAGTHLVKDSLLVMDFTDNCGKHSLVTLPSIFGLPPRLDMKGASILTVIEEMEKQELTNPDVDFSQLESLDDVDSYIEKIDLFEVKFAQEVEDNSELQWHRTPKGAYFLLLPRGERITIWEDLLTHWTVTGSVNGKSFELTEKTLPDAFQAADQLIRIYGKNIIGILRRKPTGKVTKEPIPADLVIAINGRLKRLGKPQPDYSKMSKADGAKLLAKLYAKAA